MLYKANITIMIYRWFNNKCLLPSSDASGGFIRSTIIGLADKPSGTIYVRCCGDISIRSPTLELYT
jgi:hypothetical protein